MKTLLAFFLSKRFWINLVIIIALFSFLIWLTFFILKQYTCPECRVTVPDVRGMKISELPVFFSARPFRYEIIDSVYDVTKISGTVMEQVPKPESQVKEGRKIYLTAVAILPESKPLPELRDESYRQAAAIIESYGWKVGQLIHRPDECTDCILEVHWKGREVRAGTVINVGEKLDLVLGQGKGRIYVPVPMLLGMNRETAQNLLKVRALNEGVFICDCCKSKVDSVRAIIYRQSPAFNRKNEIRTGTSIDLFATIDSSLWPQVAPDSLIEDSLHQ